MAACCSNHPDKGPKEVHSLWEILVATFTAPCDALHCGKSGKGYFSCWQCHGTQRMLTQDGQCFIKFVKDYSDFADKDHGHSIS